MGQRAISTRRLPHIIRKFGIKETNGNRERATSTPALVAIASHQGLILAVPGTAHMVAACLYRSRITVDNGNPPLSLKTRARQERRQRCVHGPKQLLEEWQIGMVAWTAYSHPSLRPVLSVLLRAGSRRAKLGSAGSRPFLCMC